MECRTYPGKDDEGIIKTEPSADKYVRIQSQEEHRSCQREENRVDDVQSRPPRLWVDEVRLWPGSHDLRMLELHRVALSLTQSRKGSRKLV